MTATMSDIADLDVDLAHVASKYFVDPESSDQGETNDDERTFHKSSKSRKGRSTQIYNKATYARLVAGCLVFDDDYDKVLMISSSKHRNKWIFPKGGIEYDEREDFRKTARRETWEEAGVVGHIVRKLPVVEDHRFVKEGDGDLLIDGDKIPRSEFHLYEMEAEELSDEWPECQKRQRMWCGYKEAKRELKRANRPELVQALEASTMARRYHAKH